MKEPSLHSFTAMGFEPITTWIIRNDRIKPDSLKWRDSSGWLYAFVVSDEVKYVGLTTRILRSRLDDYSYISEEQCAHKRQLIMAELAAGQTVWIIGRREPDENKLIAEELRLRREYKLEWNRI